MKEKIMIISSIAFLLVTPFSGCIESSPNILYVDDDGNADYQKIQNAIDNASVGDTIFVNNGTYSETILINKSINLIGANKNYTIIDWRKKSTTNQHNAILITSNNVTIKELQIISIVTSSDKVGININASYATISNTILLDNYCGINISKDTKNNTVERNTISNSRLYGIEISLSNNNTVTRNNISLSGFYGIYLSLSDGNIIFGNTVSDCGFYGVRIKASENNKVYGNTIVNNNKGIYLCCGSARNMIYYNIFKKNVDWNARDNIFNQWDNGNVGNYWDDYNGTDADNNGIGDISYDIVNGFGEANNKDRYPLMNQFDIKSITFNLKNGLGEI